MDFSQHIKDGNLHVKVKPGSDKNEIVKYDDARGELVVRIKEPAKDNRANKEVVRFMAQQIGKTVWLKSGYKSSRKLLVVED